MEQITRFEEIVRSVTPAVIREFNEERLPALEQAWGRSFREEMENENQKTVEISKTYVRPLNNTFYRHIKAQLPEFQEETTDGYDYKLGKLEIEDKNSFAWAANGWVGNHVSSKVAWHLLKKFKTDDNGRITDVFIALVDLSKCANEWEGQTAAKSNRAGLVLKTEDADNVRVLYGNIKLNAKNIKPMVEAV